MALEGCIAAPTVNPSTDLVLYHQVDDTSAALATPDKRIDKRIDCRPIGRVLKKIGTSQHM